MFYPRDFIVHASSRFGKLFHDLFEKVVQVVRSSAAKWPLRESRVNIFVLFVFFVFTHTNIGAHMFSAYSLSWDANLKLISSNNI